MNFKQITTTTILLLTIASVGLCQNLDLTKFRTPFKTHSIILYHINADSIFKDKQNIVIAELPKEAFPKYRIAISYSDSLLKKTSQFGEESGALVALNGSFFDVEKGGSVAYLEYDGKMIAMNRDSKKKWAKTDSLLNGAIVLDNSENLNIEISRGAAFYAQSEQEKEVLVSGPILLANGQELPLENSAFVIKKHPRSCLCTTTSNSVLFIAIDGRSDSASGMNLRELQQFLLRINCKDAINLDGGGSTTLWVNNDTNKRILNQPSDKEGERPVANILLIRKTKDQ